MPSYKQPVMAVINKGDRLHGEWAALRLHRYIYLPNLIPLCVMINVYHKIRKCFWNIWHTLDSKTQVLIYDNNSLLCDLVKTLKSNIYLRYHILGSVPYVWADGKLHPNRRLYLSYSLFIIFIIMMHCFVVYTYGHIYMLILHTGASQAGTIAISLIKTDNITIELKSHYKGNRCRQWRLV